MPPQAIRRMGVGLYLPIEDPLVVEGEGQCSTQVEPSPTQDLDPHSHQDVLPQVEAPQAAIDMSREDHDAPASSSPESPVSMPRSLRHMPESPAPGSGISGVSPVADQGQASASAPAPPASDQGQHGSQDSDSSGDDQVISQEKLEEARARRVATLTKRLVLKDNIHDNVIGDIRRGISTRR